MIIVGEWFVRIASIVAYRYQDRGIGLKPYLEIILDGGEKLTGYVAMEEINHILHHFKEVE